MIEQFKQYYPILNSLTEVQLGLITGLYPSCRNGVETLSVRVENKAHLQLIFQAYGKSMQQDFGDCPYMVDLQSINNSTTRVYAFDDEHAMFTGYYISMGKITLTKNYLLSDDKTHLIVKRSTGESSKEMLTNDFSKWKGRKEIAELAKKANSLCSYRTDKDQSYLHIHLGE